MDPIALIPLVPVITAASQVAVHVTKETFDKVLGKTLEYYGEELRDWNKQRRENLTNIVQGAQATLGDRISDEGGIHPKVQRAVIEEGSFSDDPLEQAYYAGVVASSWTGVSRDDRGAVAARTITRLTTYQLRAHCVFYRMFKLIYDDSGLFPGSNDRDEMFIFIPSTSFHTAMEIESSENFTDIISHCLSGLAREDLIGLSYVSGPSEYIEKQFPGIQEHGLVVQPSNVGVELFMWAHGRGQEGPHAYLHPETQFPSPVNIYATEGFRAVKSRSIVRREAREALRAENG